MKIKKAIVITDVQAPYGDSQTLLAVEKYMKDNVWDYLLILGDFLDYFCISRFNDGQPGMIEDKTIFSELREGETLLLRLIRAAKLNNPKCKVVYFEGNHEARAYAFTLKDPKMRGLIEPEYALKFHERNIQYVRAWSHSESFNIGKAFFTHGRYTNMHHAKKMVEAYEENIFYGHTHDVNSYNKTSLVGKTKVGQSLGCLCLYPPSVDYMKGAPNNWQQAITTFHFRDDGRFNYYISRIFDHEFISPEGILYTP